MKVILKRDVKGLGREGDLKEVKDGYARNHLLPTGAAVLADKGAVANWERHRDQREERDRSARADAEATAEKLRELRARDPGQGRRARATLRGGDVAPDRRRDQPGGDRARSSCAPPPGADQGARRVQDRRPRRAGRGGRRRRQRGGRRVLSVETREAARLWAEAWKHGWEALDPEPIMARYAPTAVHFTEPFREPSRSAEASAPTWSASSARRRIRASGSASRSSTVTGPRSRGGHPSARRAPIRRSPAHRSCGSTPTASSSSNGTPGTSSASGASRIPRGPFSERDT